MTARRWGDLPLTSLVHENFSVIMRYAFSQPTLVRWVEKHFATAEYLHKSVFGIAEERANIALLEFATQLRLLDDHEPLPDIYEDLRFGKFVRYDGTEVKLGFREMTNKIVHSKEIEWNFTNEDDPIIICRPQSADEKRYDWVKAEIRVADLANYCSSLMS
jgi:hypothetical protein